MNEFNAFLTDTFVYPQEDFGSDLKTINHGINYTLSVKFQPLKFMSFGGFIGFQQAYRQVDFEDVQYFLNDTFITRGQNRTNVRSLSYGLISEFHISNLCNFDESEKQFIKRFQISIPLYFGFAQSQSIDQYHSQQDEFLNTNDFVSTANANFYGKFGLKLGYQLLQRPFNLNIGLEGGYCLNKSSDVERFNNSTSVNWKNSSYNLDFSGVYYGLYLKIGK